MLFQSQANTLNPFLKMKLSPVSWIPQSHLLQLIMLQVTILSSLYCLIHCATNFFHNFTWVYECPYFVGVELLCSCLLREKLGKRNFLIWFDSLVFWWHSSLQFSCSVVSNSLWPHELQHARLSSPSPTPGVHPNPCPSTRWCHPTISSSVVPFSSCPQSFPASGSFQMTLKWCSLHKVAKVLELQLQHQSFQWTPRTDFL